MTKQSAPAIETTAIESIPETRGAYLRIAEGFTAAVQGGKVGKVKPYGFTPTGETEPRIARYLTTVGNVRAYLAETDAEKRAEMVASWGVTPTETSSRVPFTDADIAGMRALVAEYAASQPLLDIPLTDPETGEPTGETETETETARAIRVGTALVTGGILVTLRPEKAEKVKSEKADTTAAALASLFGA